MRRKLFYIYFVLSLMVLTCTISIQTVSARITHSVGTTGVNDTQIAAYCTYSYNSGTKTLTLRPANINSVQSFNPSYIAYICNKYPSAENLELLGFYGNFYGFSVPGDLTIDGIGQSGRGPMNINFTSNGPADEIRAGGTITIKNASFAQNCSIYAGNLYIDCYTADTNYYGLTVYLSDTGSSSNYRSSNNLVIRDTLTIKNSNDVKMYNAVRGGTIAEISLNNVHIEHCNLTAVRFMPILPGGVITYRYSAFPIAGNLTLIDTLYSVDGQYSYHGWFDVGGDITLKRVASRSPQSYQPTILFNKGYNIQNISGTPRYIKQSSNDSRTTWVSGALQGIPNLSTSQPLNLSGVNYNGNLTCGGLTATNSQLGTINSSGPVTLTDTQAGNITAGRGLTTNRCGVGTVTVNGDDSTKSSVIGTQLTGGTFNSVVTMDKITSTGTIKFTVGARGSVIKNGTFSGAPAVNGTNFVEVVRGTFNDSGTKSSFLLADGSEASVTDTSTAGIPGSPGVAVPYTGTCGACGGSGRTDSYSSCSTCKGTGKVSGTTIQGATSDTPGKFGQVTTVKLSNPPVVIDWGEFPGINLDLRAGTH